MNNVQPIIENLLQETSREGMGDLLQYMHYQGFYSAPCSSQFHLCYPGGLAEHSLNVYNTMLKLNEALGSNIPKETMIVAGLLHDLGKMGQFNKPNYVDNILKSGKRSDSKPYETNKDLLGIPHEIASIQIALQFIKLTEDEVFAIINHNGLYTPTGNAVKGKETKLYLILHTADMYCSRFIEVNKEG